MTDIGWDKVLTKKLIENGLDREKAGFVIGIIAEQRQIADRQGYTRGYNGGYADAQKKFDTKQHGIDPKQGEKK